MPLLSPKQSQENRDQYHIKTCNEPRIACCGVEDSCLLNCAGKKKQNPCDRHPAILFALDLLRRATSPEKLPSNQKEQYYQRGKQVSRAVEKVHNAQLARDALGHKSGSPEDRNEE